MAVENGEGKRIKTITDAMILSKQSQRNGTTLPIDPCIRTRCKQLDMALTAFCKHPDGLLSGSNGVECPDQKGLLTDTRKEPAISSDATGATSAIR